MSGESELIFFGCQDVRRVAVVKKSEADEAVWDCAVPRCILFHVLSRVVTPVQ
ncbi:hypothetical protein J6590_073193 [Homalodisca vitripennis]|nr:hypothetical protein J6590_073193 [Homalodisca vitripennis]